MKITLFFLTYLFILIFTNFSCEYDDSYCNEAGCSGSIKIFFSEDINENYGITIKINQESKQLKCIYDSSENTYRVFLMEGDFQSNDDYCGYNYFSLDYLGQKFNYPIDIYIKIG